MMTTLQCLCTPLLCGKCPTEYKSLTQLKQHLRSKYRASRRQTLIVSQKHLELQINCKECIEIDHSTGHWFPSICFPTDRVLQDHMEVAHKILNVSKNEQSSIRSQLNTCVCLKAYQCHFCLQSYNESSCLEKHWQESGHQPENKEALLSDLQKSAKIAKESCKKCMRETCIKNASDVCTCRKTFICSVCLSTFDCYPSLKKHWNMTNYHSDQDSRDVFTEMRGSDCPVCSPHIAKNCAYPEEESSDSFCSDRDAPETLLCKVNSPDTFHLKVDKVSEFSGASVSSQDSSRNISGKESLSQCLNQIMAVDTDDTDYGSDDGDIENTSTNSKQPIPLSEDIECTCLNLKCSHCSLSFSKCHDLFQHMKNVGHLEEKYFQFLKKKKKDAKSFCCNYTNWETTKGKKMKTKQSFYDKVCDTNSVNDIDKTEHSKFLNDIPQKILSSSAETKKSLVCNIQSNSPFRVTSPSNNSKNYIKDVDEAKVAIVNNEETRLLSSSPVIIMKDIEDDMETNDMLVTITIFENGTDDRERQTEPALQNMPVSPSSRYPFDLKSCFQQCLKFIYMNCTCEKITNPSSEVTMGGLNNTRICPSCCLNMNCFLCSETFSSYTNLKEHFIKDHSLQHSANKLSNPSPDYVERVSMQLQMLDCSCTDFKCKQCKVTFQQRLLLLHHILLDHPHFYPPFSFSTQSDVFFGNNCSQCSILEKLCVVNYYMFIKVLLKIEVCSDEIYAPLLQWCPSGEPFKSAVDYESKNINEDSYQEDLLFDNTGDTKVVCYSFLQQTHFGKTVHDMEKGKHVRSAECICPLLKCPDCPKTAATFGDLRKHVRLNDHNNWSKMRLLWKKYKAVKENCPSCHKYFYTSYVLCPHCPHLSFEDEDTAKTHMDSLHQGHVSEFRSETVLKCTCSKLFLCMVCKTYYRTPQGLHHHMRRLRHETRENFDAIPRMIKERMEDKRKCARCSLFVSSKVNVVRSDEDQEQCSCKWAVCNMCGNSYKKISVLIDHMRKMKHPVNLEYIEHERKKLNASFKSCQKCNSMEDRYCIFCNTRENFIYHHIKTHHQDLQILLLNARNYELKDEYDIICENRDFAKYECSVCSKRFLHTTTLRQHVRKIHPNCYFTLQCLDLSNDTLKMETFATRKKIRVLAIVSLD
ncbi:uncharacterized protein [Panulirus ornatus]|uniref:uncharacterized protein n=1 Tax=Panulirus ornatus TaxID=150431 RepID=UPI003A8B0959